MVRVGDRPVVVRSRRVRASRAETGVQWIAIHDSRLRSLGFGGRAGQRSRLRLRCPARIDGWSSTAAQVRGCTLVMATWPRVRGAAGIRPIAEVCPCWSVRWSRPTGWPARRPWRRGWRGWWRRCRCGPAGADDRVELGPDPLVVAGDDRPEGIVDVRPGCTGRGHRVAAKHGTPPPVHRRSRSSNTDPQTLGNHQVRGITSRPSATDRRMIIEPVIASRWSPSLTGQVLPLACPTVAGRAG